MTNDERYSLNRLSLRFRDRSTEAEYRDHIHAKTLTYCRIDWLLIVFLGAAFAPLDRPFFWGERGPGHLVARDLAGVGGAGFFADVFADRPKVFVLQLWVLHPICGRFQYRLDRPERSFSLFALFHRHLLRIRRDLLHRGTSCCF